ncbi:hypothetical protein Lal_00014981 [Lupinus albus]|nr:hypothetical protein Lal_00014981 [Lupinus albus]
MSSSQRPPGVPGLNPAEIAREAFRRLATRRIAPTPEAYREIYNEIAGVEALPPSAPTVDPGAETVLSGFASKLADTPGELADFGARFNRAVKQRDWDGYARTLSQLAEKHLRRHTHPALSLGAEDGEAKLLRDLLSRTLTFAVASLLSGTPSLSGEAESLGAAVKAAHSEEALQEIAGRLKDLCYQIELKGGDTAEQQELLLRLFKLLLENVSELLDDDSWMRGQIAAVQDLISGPLDHRALEDATRSLKDVIFKQGQLKHGIADVKATVKNMMMTFIDRLGSVAASTGDFHDKIGGFSERIRSAGDIRELNEVLEEVLRETKIVQAEAMASRDRMLAAHQEVQEAEARIRDLETKLQHMSELVREDQLTGSLNRRGLDDRPRRPPRYPAVRGAARPGQFQEAQRHVRPPGGRQRPAPPREGRARHAALDGRDRPLRRRGIRHLAAGNKCRSGICRDGAGAARADEAFLPARKREDADHVLVRRGPAPPERRPGQPGGAGGQGHVPGEAKRQEPGRGGRLTGRQPSRHARTGGFFF